jgi:hypothetical protein
VQLSLYPKSESIAADIDGNCWADLLEYDAFGNAKAAAEADLDDKKFY